MDRGRDTGDVEEQEERLKGGNKVLRKGGRLPWEDTKHTEGIVSYE